MKKIILLLSALIGLTCTANAQAKSGVIKINLLSPAVRTLSLFYEKPLSATSSFQLGASYTGYSISDIRYAGFAITPEYRFYLSKTSDAPAGFYVAPFLRYQNFKLTDKTPSIISSTTGSLSTFGGGLLVGHQWLVGRSDNVAIDIFLGPSYNAGSGSGDLDIASAFSGFSVRFGVTLGLAFE